MDRSSTSLLGAVEAGGTKFRAAVVTPEFEILRQERIDTTNPEATLGAVVDFFTNAEPVAALGVASFGPLIVDPESPDYGSIGATPKSGWTGAPLLNRLQSSLNVPSAVQTDVEAAAVAEFRLGAGQGHSSVGYVTIGTGIGAAVAIDGVPFRGRDHTELGHIPVRRVDGDDFIGYCPFHRDCLEGMASGPAIAKRWEADPASLEDRDEVWNLEAAYLAQLVRVYAYSFVPDVIVLGGGVGTRPDMAERVQNKVAQDLAGYSVSHAENNSLVVRAALGEDAGLIGAAILASSEHQRALSS